MKVYSLLLYVEYEGSDLLGVYGSLEDLKAAYRKLKKSEGCSYYYVASELGEAIPDAVAVGVDPE